MLRNLTVSEILRLLDGVYISAEPYYSRYPSELEEIFPKEYEYDYDLTARIVRGLRRIGSHIDSLSIDTLDGFIVFDIFEIPVPRSWSTKYVVVELAMDYDHIRVFDTKDEAYRYVASRMEEIVESQKAIT